MVGVVLFLAMALRIEDAATLTPMLTLMGVGILGAVDDFVNVRTGIGMRGRWKLVWQTAVAVLAGFYIWRHFELTGVNIPFVGKLIGEDRTLQANDVMAKAADGMLDELRKVEEAMRPLRSR